MGELTVGDVTIIGHYGMVTIVNNGEIVGTITAAGLVDAARMDDDTLSEAGAKAYDEQK